jgi:Fe-S oxidoreductase
VRRETFETLAHWEIVLFYLLIPVTLAVFFYGAWRLVRKYRQGRGQTRIDHLVRRITGVAGEIAFNRRVGRRDRAAWLGHIGISHGFIVLAIATGILMLNDDILKPFLGIEFWRGPFYLGYSLVTDLFGVALIAGLAIMAVKRLRRPARLDYARPDREPDEYDRRRYAVGDWAFLGALLFLGVTGFIMEAYRIAVTNPDYEVWSIAGWLLSRGFRAAGIVAADPTTDAARHALWWLHAGVALVTVASIPYTKAVHMLTSPVGLAVKDQQAGKRLVSLPVDATADQVGYSRLLDFSPAHLLSLDACTKCWKCHVACPATHAGFPLSPRDLILDLREAAEGSLGIRAAFHVPPLFDAARSVLRDPIRVETLWSCTTCMACVEICPVGIEHVPIINQLRRRLVELGELDTPLQSTLESIATTGNSFGESKRKRGRWAKELPEPLKDARKEPGRYLWFVGDYGSFDPRGQESSRALAEVFRRAGVDVGLLYEAEKTAGCDARRVGEEGLWASLAAGNIATLGECSFERIVTADPHTFHTLRNEYPQVGGEWPVVHHSDLLLDLLRSGDLVPARKLSATATYHDPCFLGRYNGGYEAPRQVLRMLGLEVREMPRNRDNSFCCGAGGGAIWMKEIERRRAPDGTEIPRPAEQRIGEALGLAGVDTFVVACPKDLAMYTAAAKTLGCEERIRVVELAELVLEALGPAGDAASASESRDGVEIGAD